MASPSSNRGYPVNFIKPPKEIPAECPICYHVLYQPKMVSCCGHSFCAECIGRIASDHKPCPLCNQQFTLADNKWLERTLNGYDVCCPHQEKGCEWKGELGQLERHLNKNPQPGKLEGCQFQEIQCGLCKYQCERQSMKNHDSNDCPNRAIECEYHFAGCDVKKPKQELEQHMKDSVSLHLSLVSIHMQSNLSLKEKEACELKDELRKSKDTVDGLQKMLTNQRKVMTSIIIAGIVFAILLAFLSISHVMPQVEENQSFRQQVSKEALSTQQQAFKVEINQLSKLRKKIVSQCEVLGKQLNESLATHQHANRLEMNWLLNLSNQTVSQFETLREELKESLLVQQRTNGLEISRLSTLREQDVFQQFEALREELKESLATQQQANKLEINRLFDLKKQSNHCEGTVSSQFSKAKSTCPFLPESKLKMIEMEVEYLRQQLDYPSLPVHVEFTDLKEDISRRCLLSMPFYVCASQFCMYKYLLRLVVYPEGTSRGTNTHMSVYIRLMKGQYDNHLSWPFRGVLEVGLSHHTGFRKKTFNFSNAKVPKASRRVIDGTMSNKGIGYSRFVSHEKTLRDNTSFYFVVQLLSSTSKAPHSLSNADIHFTFGDFIIIIIIIIMICCCCACIGAIAEDKRK